MLLLITFITIWALSPGPIAVMTLHESRKNGFMAGMAFVSGATVTSALMVLAGLLIHTIGFSAILDSEGMVIIERVGAIGIILMGVYSAYKSLQVTNKSIETEDVQVSANNRIRFVQGMVIFATYIPQALLYYNMIVPQSVEPEAVVTSIILLGSLKVLMIFGWHAAIAFMATKTQNWTSNNRFGKVLEVSTAGLIMLLGINILI
ncbi:MAG: LysE family transporter [Phototrophicaceae bacterium]